MFFLHSIPKKLKFHIFSEIAHKTPCQYLVTHITVKQEIFAIFANSWKCNILESWEGLLSKDSRNFPVANLPMLHIHKINNIPILRYLLKYLYQRLGKCFYYYFCSTHIAELFSKSRGQTESKLFRKLSAELSHAKISINTEIQRLDGRKDPAH